MSKHKEPCANRVGYGNPPKDRQFKKGTSGNPSGRPKKVASLNSELMRELNSTVRIQEKGKVRVITKLVVLMRQMVNQAASGNLRAADKVLKLLVVAQQVAAEEAQNLPNYESMTVEDLSDEELMWVASGRDLKDFHKREPYKRPNSKK
jgi:hypothetical protein